MTQKPMLREEVYAHALRANQNYLEVRYPFFFFVGGGGHATSNSYKPPGSWLWYGVWACAFVY